MRSHVEGEPGLVFAPVGSGGVDVPDRGAGDEAACRQPLVGVELQEVEACAYFRTRQAAPPLGTPVELVPSASPERLAVRTEEGEEVGYLSAAHSHLLRCLALGYRYAGRVVSSSTPPDSRVAVDLAART